ncbi:MAG TPA: class I SAM-dependent methyltransferase [Candidatus Binatia bacterium]|nr:class I SAM-dependent methyltransferase [Candidatus Binatia bacterium]
MDVTKRPDNYALGRTERETRRLILQHQIYGPVTRRFFEAAGIGAGMKVLDVGSGAGDVALLLADLVGPRGRVVGVDMNPEILETARARADAAGWRNVSFVAGDALQLDLDRDFDVVAGRWVLMHVPDPVALLRHLVTRLRSGGIAAFHENDFTYPPTVLPPTELSAQIQRWSIHPCEAPGAEMRMGTKLLRTYVAAGLPEPQFLVEAPAGGGADWPGYEYVADTLRSLMPMLQQRAGVDPDEVQVDTLASRLREDVARVQGIHILPIMFGAWSRRG